MEYVKLDPGTITALNREWCAMVKSEGLVLVSETDAELIEKAKAKIRVMKRKFVSPYTIEKHHLVDKVKTRQSIVNMIKRGDFGKENEGWFFDSNGGYQVLTYYIKQVNGE